MDTTSGQNGRQNVVKKSRDKATWMKGQNCNQDRGRGNQNTKEDGKKEKEKDKEGM